MGKYICEVCDHLYDLKHEDPGIPFDDLQKIGLVPLVMLVKWTSRRRLK